MKLEPKRTILGIDQAVFVQRLAMCDKAAKINHQLKTSTKERYNMDKKRRILLSSLALPALGLSACAGPALLTYQNETPKLVLRDYFNGKLKAWGMFTDRFGKVVKRFSVDMDCEWNGNQGVFDEHFVYSDGTLQRRVWHMVDEGDGRYKGVQMMSWAKPMDKPVETHFVGNTPSRSQWVSARGMLNSTTGCT